MDTVRVKICYRPLRICWAIVAGDIAAFREAVRLSHTIWGGRFNPIAIVDRVEEAKRIVELFRADMIVPISESDTVHAFRDRFRHLSNALFHDGLFVGTDERDTRAQVVDVENALAQFSDMPAGSAIKSRGVRLYEWDANDPLSDVFLMHLGEYPDVTNTRIDYRAIVKRATEATEQHLDQNEAMSAEIFDHPTVSYLSRHGMKRHYGIRSNWDYPGFYLGDAANVDDLVCCWNLRATDTAVFFVDRNHLARYRQVIPAWTKITNETLAYRRFEFQRSVAVWAQRNTIPTDPNAHVAQLQHIFGAGPFTICGIDESSLNGFNLQAPMMIFGETAQLGVLGTEAGKPKLSFALGDKPFCGETWFHSQHLVASLSFIGGLYGDELHTLDPPYIPELNEFYARTMHFEYGKFRIEPDRIGLIINAVDSDAFVYALAVAELFERIFRLAGFSARPSSGGLVTRQLITQMGGLRGAGVFKIPGVRRLLKTFGPTDPFTARDAINKIGGKDPDNPASSFKDFEDVCIEPRPDRAKLRATDVFTYLVERGLFRMGSQLTCPQCRMASWIALDVLKQRVACEMCGREFDATRQLVTGKCHYRRTGVLGAEKNALGAVPVALTLHQLRTNLSHPFGADMYTTSLDLVPENNATLPSCEVDCFWLVTGRYPEKTTIILGECKDRGRGRDNSGDGGTISSTDIGNLKAVANALPANRFEAFVLLAKLCPFTPQEIDAAKVINEPYGPRAILLTARELEPRRMYDRIKADIGSEAYAGSAEDLARTTAAMYFGEPKPESKS